MNYTEYKNYAQNKYNALPIFYAFGQKQFDEMLQNHFNGMTMEEAEQKLYSTGAGGYYLRSDAEQIRKAIIDIDETQARLISEDATGEGFIYQMFLCELENHEYIISHDIEETLDAVGITADELEASPQLRHGLKKAIDEIIKNR